MTPLRQRMIDEPHRRRVHPAVFTACTAQRADANQALRFFIKPMPKGETGKDTGLSHAGQ